MFSVLFKPKPAQSLSICLYSQLVSTSIAFALMTPKVCEAPIPGPKQKLITDYFHVVPFNTPQLRGPSAALPLRDCKTLPKLWQSKIYIYICTSSPRSRMTGWSGRCTTTAAAGGAATASRCWRRAPENSHGLDRGLALAAWARRWIAYRLEAIAVRAW